MGAEKVVQHWILLVAGVVESQDGWGREVRHHAYFFYLDDRLVTSMDRPDMAAGSVRHSDRTVQYSGTLDKHQEDGQDDLTPLPVRRDQFGGGIWTAYDGGEANILREKEGKSLVFGMW